MERKRLHGLAPHESAAAPPGQGLYDAAAGERTYARLRALARDALAAGWPVVVDAAFLQRAQRAPFAALAREMGVRCTLLWCQAPESVLQQRLAARHDDPSDADAAVLARQQALHEPPEAGEGFELRAVDTTRPVEAAALA